ncbi:VOC family protein [Streptomyces violaceoruber]
MITVTPAAQRLRSQYAAGHATTADLDRLVGYYTELLGAALAFERAATGSDPRVAAVDVGGDVHLMIVETGTPPSTDLDPLGNAGWGFAWAPARGCAGSAVESWIRGGRSDRSRHFPRSGR